MTMKITVTNADALRVASVVEEEFALPIGNAPQTVTRRSCSLNAGESRDFWIHASRRLLVSEDAGAFVPKPSED